MLQESADTIAKLKERGLSNDAIKSRLALAGWSPQRIDAALGAAGAAAPRRKERYSRGTLTLLALTLSGVAIGGAGGLYALTYSKQPDVYAISLQGAHASSSPLSYGVWPQLADPNFYGSVRERFIEEQASFITADLSAMTLTVYMGGEPALEVPILAKGKSGSWWETPVGLYEIQTREENHFSSFGQVYQPYSLAFQGNFFIHGWPYYEDGTEVSSSYSGGCIRLSTDDARRVYQLAKVGMPVMVYNTPQAREPFEYRYKAPTVDATAYVVADIEDGTVLASENAAIQLPIASVTKLMTALVAVEYLNIERVLSVPQSALVETAGRKLAAGTEYTVRDLLALMLVESSNQAAETIAGAVGRDRFVELMNKKALSIGLDRTTFLDPSGLSTGNSSTAEDLFSLIKYLRDNRRFILDMTVGSAGEASYGPLAFKQMQNFNKVPGVKNAFLGGKVGETDAAKETYAGIFTLELEGTKRDIAVVVLGAPDAQPAVAELLQYLNAFYVSGEGLR